MRVWILNIFLCTFLIIFPSFNTVVYNDIRGQEYFNYIHAVIQHLQSQVGWHSMQHIRITNDKRTTSLSIVELLALDLKNHKNVIDMYNKIVELVNYRYAEILKTIIFQMTYVTYECYNFNQIHSYENFVYCILSLQEVLNYSETLFENLYAALTFLSLIDVKIVSKRYVNYSNYIVDTLYYVKEYASSMEIGNYSTYLDGNGVLMIKKALNILESIVDFCQRTKQKLIEIPPKNTNVIIRSTIECDYEQIYKEHYAGEDFVSFMSMRIMTFMDDAQKNDFMDLGFLQLMCPTSIG